MLVCFIYDKKKIIEKMSESLIFAHFLFFGERCEWIAHFAQIKWAMWANRSFRSPKMSDHERFAQFAQRKWAMCGNRSFRSPKMSNEWIAHFFERIAHSLIFGQQTSDSLGNQMSEFPALTTWSENGQVFAMKMYALQKSYINKITPYLLNDPRCDNKGF